MKDTQGDPVQGRIRWRRFAAVAIPAAAAAGAIVFGMATGAIAAQFTVSGQDFKVSANSLHGTNFSQYGGKVVTKEHPGGVPVVTSVIGDATMVNLCQSVAPQGLGVSMVIRAGRGPNPGDAVHATNLVIDMKDLRGNATFTNINIGQDAGDLSHISALNGMFGQRADVVDIVGLRQTALATTAGSFALNGLHLYLDTGTNPEECFATETSK